MNRLALISLIIFNLSACSTENSKTMSVDDVLSNCHRSTNGKSCNDLDGKTVTIRGYLDNGGYYDKPVLVSNKTKLESYNRETLNNIHGIEFLVSNITREKYEPYLGRSVIVKGEVFTDCVIKAIQMDEHREQQPESIEYNGDVVVIRRMLTGTCHYLTNPYMVKVKISVVT